MGVQQVNNGDKFMKGMALRRAILIELFAILLVLYGFGTMYSERIGYSILLHIGFYLGLIGFVYGLAGSFVSSATQNET